MVSSEASSLAVQATGMRNPRRRQRKDSEEGATLRHQPQRKRSKLSDDTSDRPTSNINGSSSTYPNGHVKGSSRLSSPSPQIQEIPVREKKQAHGQRVARGDGSTTLTKNANYAVKQLPSFPDQLRRQAYRGTVLSSGHYALALTHDNAFIWNYTSTTVSPTPRILKLPHPTKPTDPLSLGALVGSNPAAEIGLIVIAPISGKIIFWENIDYAQIATLFQQRRDGDEGSVSLYSGETVIDLVEIGHAGFVIVLSSGRTAQLTLRDSQGRPAVKVHFLRGSIGGATGGFLGGLKNVFGVGGWRKEVAAIRSRPSERRGQMEVIVATEVATLQVWDLDWSGQSTFKADVDAYPAIEIAVKSGSSVETQDPEPELKMLDFVLHPTNPESSTEVARQGDLEGINVLALVSVSSKASLKYLLVEMELGTSTAAVERVIPLHTYSAPSTLDAPTKSKLLLPKPAHTAFVVFPHAVTLVSTAVRQQKNTPDLQLMLDSRKLPEPFQDTVYFRNDDDFGVVGSVVEENAERSRQSSCVIFVERSGIVRFVGEEPVADRRSAERGRMTVRSKIEQAVFYGAMPTNLLDLSRKPEIEFAQEEVETAVLGISNNILRSETPSIPLMTALMDEQLKQREGALRHLAEHIRANYPPLSRLVKWRLLLDAEKLVSAHAVWRSHDAHLRDRGAGHRSLLAELVDILHERFKTEPDAELGEMDPVRQWFTKDVWRIETIIPWAQKIIKELYADGAKDEQSIMRLVSEADDLTLAALESAFEFRMNNAALYGLEHEPLEDGILISETAYQGLPEFWTSTYNIVHSLTQLVKLARGLCRALYERESHREPKSSGLDIAKKVAGENARLAAMCCRVHVERYRWLLARDNEKDRATGRSLRTAYDDVRREQISRLAEIGMAPQGMALAERLHDMQTLANLVLRESQHLLSQLVPGIGEDERAVINDSMRSLEARVKRYFDTFGEDWANAMYTNHIEKGHLAGLLDDNAAFQGYVTKYLRSNRKCAKLSWINDVIGEKDFANASQTLASIAATEETNIWNKKVELSLAKLSLLAVNEDDHDSATFDSDKASVERQLEIVIIQERLHEHVKGSLYGALDQKAELELAFDAYAKENTKELPALQQLLELGLEALINHQAMELEQLIDVLTLMDHRPTPDKHDDIAQREFFLALKVLRASGFKEENKPHYDALLKLIWRRCMIRDKWEVINNTQLKSDAHLQEELEATTLFKTLWECSTSYMWTTPPTVEALTPSEVIEANIELFELRYRFPSEDLREPIAQDIVMEASLLRHLRDKCRLGYWWKEVHTRSLNSVEQEKENQAKLMQRQDALEERIRTGEEAEMVGGDVIDSVEVEERESNEDLDNSTALSS